MLKPNSKRALNAVTLLWVDLWISFCSLCSAVVQLNNVKRVKENKPIDAEFVRISNLAEAFISVAYLVFFILSAIFFIMWFRRAYNNLQQLTKLKYNEGWAAGAWFVPILSLFRPFQMMQEMYREVGDLLRTNNANNTLKKSHLGWWWGLWVISNILGQMLFWFTLRAETTDEIFTSAIINLIDTLIQIPLALLAIKTVREYAYAELELPAIYDKMHAGINDNEGLFTASEYRRYLEGD